MPNPNYRPDQPEYYNSSNKLDALNNIVDAKANELQKQNEQEIQKQQEVPKAMM